MKQFGLLTLAVFLAYNEIQKKKEAPVYYTNRIIGGFNGITIPPFGIFIKESERDNKMLLEHERIHWMQYQREGLFPFLKNYIKQHRDKGYDNNPYEIEARLLSGECVECLQGYTKCVRNGKALTVQNTGFRRV
ncbi:hypothetical protein [Kordia sp.]|uniref:hypothetical protein n=1 Tax=Kordia sp. TaxID=1965332 RepID=UPI0025C3DDC9|nr:hypothetical protein [Kordia sp.]MCH2194731.1 hypothetical protein [Kordia sp.]